MQSLKIYWSLFLLSTEVAEPTHIQQQTRIRRGFAWVWLGSSATTRQSSFTNTTGSTRGSSRPWAFLAHSDTCTVDYSTKHTLKCTWGHEKQATLAISYCASWKCCKVICLWREDKVRTTHLVCFLFNVWWMTVLKTQHLYKLLLWLLFPSLTTDNLKNQM